MNKQYVNMFGGNVLAGITVMQCFEEGKAILRSLIPKKTIVDRLQECLEGTIQNLCK